MDNKKSGFVTLVGRPNVGKSTLTNKIVGQKVTITSKKPQTTRNKINTVYTSDEGQIVFVDTPGFHKAKNKLGSYMVSACLHTINEVDVILWLVEATDFIGPLETEMAAKLKTVKCPVILVINKTDMVQPDMVVKSIETYREMMDFAEIVPISAFNGTNVDELIKTVYKYLPYGPYYYDEEMVTDQPVKQIAAEMIREKALRNLEKEIPHGIAVLIDSFKYRDDSETLVDIVATIVCERDSHKGIIIGKGGSMLKKIGIEARKDIERMLECKVNLKLFVKVKSNWRDSDYLVSNYGYNKDEL